MLILCHVPTILYDKSFLRVWLQLHVKDRQIRAIVFSVGSEIPNFAEIHPAVATDCAFTSCRECIKGLIVHYTLPSLRHTMELQIFLTINNITLTNERISQPKRVHHTECSSKNSWVLSWSRHSLFLRIPQDY